MREELAEAARICARMGLVEAFGHVSARLPDGGFLITSIGPLIGADAAEALELSDGGELLHGDAALLPLETPLHTALYAARSDVGAACRTHSPHAVAWGASQLIPPIVQGLDGLSGEIAFHGDVDLVTDRARADAAIASLGRSDCLLISANGNLASGRDLAQAVVRAWFLEQRAAAAERVVELADSEGRVFEQRARHYDVESGRAWAWCLAQFGDSATARKESNNQPGRQ